MPAARKVLVLLLALVAAGVPAQPAAAGPWTPWPGAGAHRPGVRAAQPAGAARDATVKQLPGGARVPVPAPETVALDASTQTLYVTSDTGIVAVVDAARCSAHAAAGCGAPVATIDVGANPVGIAIDDRSHTGYVANIEDIENADDGTVSVFDAATCNAQVTSGCPRAPATVTTGGSPIGVAVNRVTHTVYAGNDVGFVSVIDATRCNGSVTTGCANAPATITTGPGSIFPLVDEATDTVYVPEAGAEDPSAPPSTTMAVIDGSACNASTTAGCGRAPVRVTVGFGPVAAAIDPTTHTVYVENGGDLTVSVVDGAICNARDTSGCGQTPATTRVGAEPNSSLVVDPATRTLYVVNTGSDTVSAVDIRQCAAGDTSGCSRRSPTIQTGNQPYWIVLDPSTGTLYVPEYIDNDVTALDARACNALRPGGCRGEAPTIEIPNGVFSVAVDPDRHTLYTGGGENGAIGLVDTRNCRAGRLASCGATPVEVPIGTELRDILVDRGTDTVYLADATGSVFVLDAERCNVSSQAGCAPFATIAIGADTVPIAFGLDPRTHTIYVADIVAGTVSVIDGAHCNALDRTGCAAAPPAVPVGPSPFGVAVDPATDSVYVSLFDGDAVAVLHGSEPVTTFPVGSHPVGLGIDRATHTLYVANQAFNDAPGSVSVVDTSRCNRLDPGGCRQSWPAVPTGRGTWAIAVDPGTHRVFTVNYGDATASVIEGASCNATDTTGCDRRPPRVPIGNIPLDLTLNRASHTLYASNAPDRSVSVIDSRAPCSNPVRCEP